MFAPSEELYHRISHEDIDGDALLHTAIRLPGCSVNRGKYSEPKDVLVAERPLFDGVAVITPERVPAPFHRESDQQLMEFLVWDDPLPENPAHAEIRLRRSGAEYTRNLRGTVLEQAAGILATGFRILHMPSLPAEY